MQGSVSNKTSSSDGRSAVGGLSNSSSPAPGLGRPMRGVVRGYDARTGMGKIKGEDGATYSFFTPGVLGGVTLQPGQNVSFTDNDGVATKIAVMAAAANTSTSSVGGLANSSSPAPGPGRPTRGIVHTFDPRAGMGKIKGEDGATYTFFSAGIVGGRSVRAGTKVEFTDNDGVATKITLVRGRLARLLFR